MGRVEWLPAVTRDEYFNPRMRRARGFGREIAADVTCRDLQRPAQADHHVGIVLTDALPLGEDVAYVSVNLGGLTLVGQMTVDELHDVLRALPDIGLAGDRIDRQTPSSRLHVSVLAGENKVVKLFGLEFGLQLLGRRSASVRGERWFWGGDDLEAAFNDE